MSSHATFIHWKARVSFCQCEVAADRQESECSAQNAFPTISKAIQIPLPLMAFFWFFGFLIINYLII
jgi:hypothetical protein